MLRLYVNVWYELSTRRMFSGLRSVWMRLRSCKTTSALAFESMEHQVSNTYKPHS